MAEIKGITIELNGDTTGLQEALRKVRNETKQLDTELNYINKSLKFNPTSFTMWSQKQKLLTKEVEGTQNKLKELKNTKKQLEAQGLDRNSAEFRQVEREITKCQSQLRAFRKELISVGSARLNALSAQFKQMGQKLTSIGTTLTTKVTMPLALLGGAAVKSFADVDKIMVLTNKTMSNTEEEAKLLDTAMKEAAANSTFGMNEAATATLNFARAGLKADEAAAALAPAMNLAAGEGGNLETVSAGLVATINGFADSFDEAGKYADVFANACNNSALDIDSLSNSMSVAAPIFSAAGYSVEDAALYMGIMANNGIEANKAANSLKTGLARLITPTKEGATWIEKLGLSFTNTDGSMKDTVEIQNDLHNAFKTLSESEQIAAASAIFGKTQMAPWLALINTGTGDVENLAAALGQEGTTAEMAASQMSGFGGSLEKLKSSLDVAITSLGQALAPVISKVAEYLQKAVDWFNSLDDSTRQMIATVGVVVAAIGPVIVLLGTVFTSIGTIMGALSKAIGVIKLVVSVLGGPLTAAIAAAIAIGVLLYKNWDTIKAKAAQLKDWVVAKWTELKTKVEGLVIQLKTKVLQLWDNIKTGIQNAILSAVTWGLQKFIALRDGITNIFNGIKTVASNVWAGIKLAITHPIETAFALIKKIVEKIKSLFSNLKISIPHIKTPHFSISPAGWKIGDLLKGVIPKLGINWYKTGGIFNSPSVIGVGEAGPEAVVPIDKLRDIMAGLGGTTINVYAAPGMNINELAIAVQRKIIETENRRKLAWR